MRERNISVDDVIEALRRPSEHVYDRLRGLYIAYGGRGVAVVYAYHPPLLEVVTVLGEREYRALLGRLGWRRYRVVGLEW